MMDDGLRELYQEVILDHGRNPRHFGSLDAASHEAHGHNPLCGDRIHLFLQVGEDGRVADVAFDGKGCAISIASASMMTELIKGKTVEDARALAEAFYHLAKGETAELAMADDDMDRLNVMSGVSQFPMRVKCATLAWHTFDAALENKTDAEVVEP